MRLALIAIVMFVVSSEVGAQSVEPAKLPVPVPDLVKALIDVLKDADAEVRINSANALAAIGSPAIDSLTAALVGPNRDARAAAAYALGQMGSEGVPAVAALVKALQDAETEVRRQAAQALGRILLANRAPAGVVPPVLAPPTPLLPPPVFPPEKPVP